MQIVLEKGLEARPSKMGAGDKEAAFKVKQSRLRTVIYGVCVVFLVLLIVSVSYVSMFKQEQARAFIQNHRGMKLRQKDKSENVRLGIAMQQVLTEDAKESKEMTRILKRISARVERGFDELLEKTGGVNYDADQLRVVLGDTQKQLRAFVDDELGDFQKKIGASDKINEARLAKLAKIQEQSLRDILTTVSGVKMESLSLMLDDLFDALDKTEHIELSEQVADDLDDLADKLYEEAIDLAEGRAEFKKQFSAIIGDRLPLEMKGQLDVAKDTDEFADALDALAEMARLSAGRKELVAIEKQYRRDIAIAQKEMENAPEDDDEEDDDYVDPEAEVVVETMLKVHRLVADGKVPTHLLDFESLNLDEEYEGEDDESLDDDAAPAAGIHHGGNNHHGSGHHGTNGRTTGGRVDPNTGSVVQKDDQVKSWFGKNGYDSNWAKGLSPEERKKKIAEWKARRGN